MIKQFIFGVSLALFSIFYSIEIHAEANDSIKRAKLSGFYTVSAISPDFCFITVKIRPEDSGKNHNWEYYYINQKASFGYRYEQLIGWQKNNHWGFEGGAELCKKIMSVDFANYKTVPEVRVKNNSILTVFYRTVFNSVNIPLRVVFTAGKKKLQFFSFFGINKTFCFKIYQEALYYSNNQIESKKLVTADFGAKKYFSASDWGAGIKYNLSKKAQLRLNGAVQRSYASMKSYNKKILFWSSGISLGYVYAW